MSQLYQLRGGLEEGRQRAYAYLTSVETAVKSEARRRLEVMQTLDTWVPDLPWHHMIWIFVELKFAW